MAKTKIKFDERTFLREWKSAFVDGRPEYYSSAARNAIISAMTVTDSKVLGDQRIIVFDDDRRAKIVFFTAGHRPAGCEVYDFIVTVTIYSKTGGETASNFFVVPVYRMFSAQHNYCSDADRRKVAREVVKCMAEVTEYIDLHR